MSEPVVAVVITAFESAATIGAAIDSVLAQRILPQRVIVVDNSPGDDGAAIARCTLSARALPFEILRIPNQGPGNARNAGWRAAAAEWIQFLDADDVLAPDKLALQLPIAARAADGVAFLHGPWQRQKLIAGQWAAVDTVLFNPGAGDLLADLLRADGFIPAAAGLLRSEWLERVGGFDEEHWVLEDIDLQLRLALAGATFEAAPHSEPLFYYRVRQGSLSRGSRIAFARALVWNAETVQKTLGRALPRNIVQSLADLYWRAAYALADNFVEFADLMTRIDQLEPPRSPVDRSAWRTMLRYIGTRGTSYVVKNYRALRRLLPATAER